MANSSDDLALVDEPEPKEFTASQQRVRLEQRLEAEIQANQQLLGLIDQLDRQHDLLFSSLTWRVGYFFAQSVRKLMFWADRQALQSHLTRDHFRNILGNCAAYALRRQERPEIDDIAAQTGESDITPYTYADVEITLRMLWDSIGAERDADEHQDAGSRPGLRDAGSRPGNRDADSELAR